MCIALPGKLIEMDEMGFFGTVDFRGNKVDVTLGAVDAQVGDYVLVHAGNAIEVVTPEVAEDVLALLAELEDVVTADVAATDGAADRAMMDEAADGVTADVAAADGAATDKTAGEKGRKEQVFPLFRGAARP
jgi:hydrogenase expression/formation protein HypC